MEGVGRFGGGIYDNIVVEGVSSCSDDIKAEKIRIQGVFSCSGQIEAGELVCEGVSDFKANIRARKLNVEGVFNTKKGVKIEAEEIICDGVIKASGEIYADILTADGCVTATEVYGDRIKIHTHYSVNKILKIFNKQKSEIKLIEATTIDISGVMVDILNGRDITVGPNCTVDSIDCSGSLYIDPSSYVRNISGDHVRR